MRVPVLATDVVVLLRHHVVIAERILEGVYTLSRDYVLHSPRRAERILLILRLQGLNSVPTVLRRRVFGQARSSLLLRHHGLSPLARA